jgi:tol-pal system protein YbgF
MTYRGFFRMTASACLILMLLISINGCGRVNSMIPRSDSGNYKALEDRIEKLEKKTEEIKEKKAPEPDADSPQAKDPAQAVENDKTNDKGGQATESSTEDASGSNQIAAASTIDVDKQYSKGRSLYVLEDYIGAAEVFLELAHLRPAHALAPNAVYWLGECFYGLKQFRQAIKEFEKVAEIYPKSDKAPDALLKIAYSYSMLDEGKVAMAQLKSLLNKYPDSRAAKMVKEGKTIFKP